MGISAKARHKAVKYSRLSDSVDFSDKWYGKPCSRGYWQEIQPVFAMLRTQQKPDTLFRELENKEVQILPLLAAFIRETDRSADPAKMMGYLLGRNDFYKVIKDNGNVILESFNMVGTLK